MGFRVDYIAGLLRLRDVSTTYAFGRKKNANNIFLENAGNFSNLTPVTISERCKLYTISATTQGVETWSVDVYRNGSPLIGGVLNITGTDSGYVNNLNIELSEGDKISVFCNGVNIKNPSVILETIK